MGSTAAEHDGALKLHVGCGTVVVPGWENIDKSPNVVLSRVPVVKHALARLGVITQEHLHSTFSRDVVHADVLSGLPYPDRSARFVYHAHVIEHMSRERAVRFVRECARLLAPGGVMRVATPDLAELVDAYGRGERGDLDPTAADHFMRSLQTYADFAGPRLQVFLRRNFGSAYFHQWLYDEVSLTRLLREGGFTEIERRSFRAGEVPDLDLLEHRTDGLFMEGRLGDA